MHADGVVVLRGAIDEARCRAIRAACTRHLPTDRPARLTNAWWTEPTVRSVAVDPGVLDAIGFLYGRRAIPFQTLTFRCGTEQDEHPDSLHFDSLPPSFLCGAWVALEDVGESQGPLRYRPGSHRPDWVAEGSREATFTGRCGDVLLWAAGVRHGGGPIEDPASTRWSMVTHHLFEDCVWYTPLHSDVERGDLRLRDPLRNLDTGRREQPTLFGLPPRFTARPRGRVALRHPDAPVHVERSAPGVRVALAGHRVRAHLSSVVAPRLARLRRRPPGSTRRS
jgi:hypothetical protein